MRLPRRKKMNVAIPLASTADVAFLLLIFFIVLAKNARESGIDWRPAVSDLPMVDASDAPATIIIDKNRLVYFNGEEISLGKVRDLTGAALGDLPVGRRPVLLKVDKEVPESIYSRVLLDIGDVGGEVVRSLEDKPQP